MDFDPKLGCVRIWPEGVNALQTLGSFPFPFSPISPPSPFSSLHFPLLSPFPFNPSRDLGRAVSSPSGSERSPATKRILVHFEVKGKHFRVVISCIFWQSVSYTRDCVGIFGAQHTDRPRQVKYWGSGPLRRWRICIWPYLVQCYLSVVRLRWWSSVNHVTWPDTKPRISATWLAVYKLPVNW